MNYELAKQLKEAGFPGKDYVWMYQDGVTAQGLAPSPTLQELIDACGGFFFAISHWPEGWTAEGGTVIQHGESNEFTAQTQCKNCSTAEEAVAKLWLALNTHG